MTEIVHFPIHETPSYSLFFELEYEWVPASGDGWNEPREQAHWELQSIKLYSVERKLFDRPGALTTDPISERFKWRDVKTYIEPIPPWLERLADDVDPLDHLGDPRD